MGTREGPWSLDQYFYSHFLLTLSENEALGLQITLDQNCYWHVLLLEVALLFSLHLRTSELFCCSNQFPCVLIRFRPWVQSIDFHLGTGQASHDQ